MTPERQAEADRVELVYYWALTQLGNSMAVDSLELWSRESPVDGGSRGAWMSKAISLIAGYRAKGQELALSYYRLVSALRTGQAPRLNSEPESGSVSLESLRTTFEAVVDEVEAETAGDAVFDPGIPDALPAEILPAYDPGNEQDAVELLDMADIDQLIADADEFFDETIEQTLDTLGGKNYDAKVKKIEAKKRGPDAEDPEAARYRAFNEAGTRQASAAMRIMLNASRGLVYDLSETDIRIAGWARHSKTNNPCSFCAILISREVLYSTRKSALVTKDDSGNRSADEFGDMDKYHDNCKCVAIPVFDMAQYRESDLFDQNKHFRSLWDTHIKGNHYGAEARRKWRQIVSPLIEPENDASSSVAPEAA